MLNRLVRDVWDLDSFFIEVQNRYPNKFTKEALEVIFDQLEDYPGYCCIETLTEDFDEWTLEKLANLINEKYRKSISPEEVWDFIYDNWTNDGEITHDFIFRVLSSTVLVDPYLGFKSL